MRIKRVHMLAATLTGALAATAAGLALSGVLASASPGGSEPAGSAPTAGEIASPSAGQVAAFPVLGAPATPADGAISSATALDALREAQARYAANPLLGRVVAQTPAGAAAIVPGEGVLCLLVLRPGGQAGSLCEPDAQAAAEGLGAREDVAGERYALIGVFPSSAGASDLRLLATNGVETPVQLSADAGYALETKARPAQLRWSDADGTQHSRTLAWPPLPGSG